jgi:nucleoside-triphosphatase THEP1
MTRLTLFLIVYLYYKKIININLKFKIMKKELIKKLVNELENDGYDVEGFVCDEGVMSSDYGLVEYEFFDNIEDDEIKDYLIDYLEE